MSVTEQVILNTDSDGRATVSMLTVEHTHLYFSTFCYLLYITCFLSLEISIFLPPLFFTRIQITIAS